MSYITFNEAGIVVEASKGVLSLFGCDRESELRGLHVSDLWPFLTPTSHSSCSNSNSNSTNTSISTSTSTSNNTNDTSSSSCCPQEVSAQPQAPFPHLLVTTASQDLNNNKKRIVSEGNAVGFIGSGMDGPDTRPIKGEHRGKEEEGNGRENEDEGVREKKSGSGRNRRERNNCLFATPVPITNFTGQQQQQQQQQQQHQQQQQQQQQQPQNCELGLDEHLLQLLRHQGEMLRIRMINDNYKSSQKECATGRGEIKLYSNSFVSITQVVQCPVTPLDSSSLLLSEDAKKEEKRERKGEKEGKDNGSEFLDHNIAPTSSSSTLAFAHDIASKISDTSGTSGSRDSSSSVNGNLFTQKSISTDEEESRRKTGSLPHISQDTTTCSESDSNYNRHRLNSSCNAAKGEDCSKDIKNEKDSFAMNNDMVNAFATDDVESSWKNKHKKMCGNSNGKYVDLINLRRKNIILSLETEGGQECFTNVKKPDSMSRNHFHNFPNMLCNSLQSRENSNTTIKGALPKPASKDSNMHSSAKSNQVAANSLRCSSSSSSNISNTSNSKKDDCGNSNDGDCSIELSTLCRQGKDAGTSSRDRKNFSKSNVRLGIGMGANSEASRLARSAHRHLITLFLTGTSEMEQAMLTSPFAQDDFAIMKVSRWGRIEFVPSCSGSFLGIRAPKLSGRSLMEFVPEHEMAYFCRQMQRIFTEKRFSERTMLLSMQASADAPLEDVELWTVPRDGYMICLAAPSGLGLLPASAKSAAISIIARNDSPESIHSETRIQFSSNTFTLTVLPNLTKRLQELCNLFHSCMDDVKAWHIVQMILALKEIIEYFAGAVVGSAVTFGAAGLHLLQYSHHLIDTYVVKYVPSQLHRLYPQNIWQWVSSGRVKRE